MLSLASALRQLPALALVGVISASSFLFAQGMPPDQQSPGLPVDTLHLRSKVDAVQIDNGNLHIEIPIWSYKGRSADTYSSALVYDSKGWFGNQVTCVPSVHNCYISIVKSNPIQLSEQRGPYYWLIATWQTTTCGVNQSTVNFWSNFYVVEADGTRHPFPLTVWAGGLAESQVQNSCMVFQNAGYAADGSGWFLDYTNDPSRQNIPVLYRRDGGKVLPRVGSSIPYVACWLPASCGIQDPNGNTGDGTGQAPPPNLGYHDSTGANQQLTITYQAVALHTAMCMKYYRGALGCTESTASQSLPHIITLPDGLSYTIEYVQNSYGQPSSVTLPTGAVVTYSWSGEDIAGPVLLSRSETVNGITSTWNYTVSSTGGSQPGYINKLTDPLGNDTTYTCGWNNTGGCTLVKYYRGSSTAGTLLKTVQTDFKSSGSIGTLLNPWSTMSIGHLPIRVTTTLNDTNQVSKTETDWEFINQPPPVNWISNIFGTVATGNPTEVREYDFGSGAPGHLVRRTDYTYLHNSSSPYLSAHIINKPSSVLVYDGSGTLKSKTLISYDTTAIITPQNTTAPGHNSAYTSIYTVRGNSTQVSKLVSGTTMITTKTTSYDIYGNLRSSTDGNGNTTQFDYDDNFANTINPSCISALVDSQAFLTKITDALTHVTNSSYYPCTGLLASRTDANSQTSSYSYDLLNRVIQTTYPDGGSTKYCYTDVGGAACVQSGPPYSIVMTRAIASSPSLNEISTMIADGLGRITQTQLNSDPSGTDYTVVQYDAVGRKSVGYNPTRCIPPATQCNEASWGYRTYSYDALGRVMSVVEQDGSTISTSYLGNCTTVTDETGNSRKSCVDALGRLTSVWEDPGSAPHLNYETDYTYDVLNNLISVTQKGGAASGSWRTRTFTYDSLSRLVCVANPEVQAVTCPTSATGTIPNGAIKYTYDNYGNILTKNAPSPNQSSTGTATVTTTYVYDALNRLTGKSYNDSYTSNPVTPSVTYGYDGITPPGCTPPNVVSPTNSGIATTPTNTIGRRSSMCDRAGSTAWVYDSMGRSTIEQRVINGVNKNIGYIYYLDGETAQMYYPSGNRVWAEANAAGRQIGVKDSSFNYVVHNAVYTPHGALQEFHNAAAGADLMTENYFSPRLQLVATYNVLGSNPPSYPLFFSRCYDFHLKNGGTFGNSSASCVFAASASGDNGNLYQVKNNLDGNRTQNYTYDTLNRISQASTSGSNWGETFTIDPWGNLTNRGPVSGKTLYEPLSAAPASTQNRLPGFAYDAAGNMIMNGSASYSYDAENRLMSTAGYSYVYDGNGNRLIKCSGSFPTCSLATLYWLGQGNATFSESDLGGNINGEYTYFNGMRVARRDVPGNVVHFYLNDHLGTARMVLTASSATNVGVDEDADYYPYGGEIVVSGSTSATRYKFTGKERDSESGLDNFGARYNASSLGRFMSPDPSAAKLAVQHDPQEWNLYSYTRNSPLSAVDPTGKETELITLGPRIGGQSFGMGAGSSNPFGHSTIRIRNSSGDFAYSFDGRKDDNGRNKLILEKIPWSQYLHDKNYGKDGQPQGAGVFNYAPNRSVTGQVLDWKTDGKEEKATQAYLENLYKKSQNGDDIGDFNARTNNCAENAAKALEAGGLKLVTDSNIAPEGLEAQVYMTGKVVEQEQFFSNATAKHFKYTEPDHVGAEAMCREGNPAACIDLSQHDEWLMF